jgi:hypothetical protein
MKHTKAAKLVLFVKEFFLPGIFGWIRGELFFLQASGLYLFPEFLEVKVFS